VIILENKRINNIKMLEETNLTCSCSNKHVPNPMQLIEISYDGQRQVVCPTFLVNLIDLLQTYELLSGPPPGSITKHYGKDIRDLAKSLWAGP